MFAQNGYALVGAHEMLSALRAYAHRWYVALTRSGPLGLGPIDNSHGCNLTHVTRHGDLTFGNSFTQGPFSHYFTSVPRVLRALCGLLALSVVACLGPVLTASPAAASVTILCKGYDGCKAQGMGHGGYKAASSSMYWRMYAGHNCTNYVAYRMVKSGLPNMRPWTGSGNAMYWGVSMPRITDAVPSVGAVAWWEANVKGASGSAGHVAYVERVVSADEIIVSQDIWGGDFPGRGRAHGRCLAQRFHPLPTSSSRTPCRLP